MANTFASKALVLATIAAFSAQAPAKTPHTERQIDDIVDRTLQPLMKAQGIAGMAVAVLYDGQAHFYNYGVSDTSTGRPVTEDTLFELGSLSKTFAGIAGAYAMTTGGMDLDDPVTAYAPELTGPQWRDVDMLHLATYTAGGLPLQIPDEVTNEEELWEYYRNWKPRWSPGTMRLYSNASIGLFGKLAVSRSHLAFEDYLAKFVLQPMALTRTFITVPESLQADYAWGYKQGKPVRVTMGMLGDVAYGVKSTSRDMARYLQVNMDPGLLPAGAGTLKEAIVVARSHYFRLGDMSQGLGWESYRWPIDLKRVVSDVDNPTILDPRKVEALVPPTPATAASWVHKTGATNGFGAYVAFVPEQKIGIVMLANQNYPNTLRVEAAYRIIQALSGTEPGGDGTGR